LNKKKSQDSPKPARKEREEGEDESSSEEDGDESTAAKRKHRFKNDTHSAAEEAKEVKQLSEEEGEINDGEKLRKTFVPRVLCKFYQRGKCSWGRSCKFLHPGVNDTGNYTFLELDDPNARVYQQQTTASASSNQAENPATNQEDESEDMNNVRDLDRAPAPPVNETAWEKALRQAREMKEKAKLRKQAEQKEDFLDKKMNLSLKEFENEKENDERYLNIEK
jgi:nuclear protein NHN1